MSSKKGKSKKTSGNDDELFTSRAQIPRERGVLTRSRSKNEEQKVEPSLNEEIVRVKSSDEEMNEEIRSVKSDEEKGDLETGVDVVVNFVRKVRSGWIQSGMCGVSKKAFYDPKPLKLGTDKGESSKELVELEGGSKLGKDSLGKGEGKMVISDVSGAVGDKETYGPEITLVKMDMETLQSLPSVGALHSSLTDLQDIRKAVAEITASWTVTLSAEPDTTVGGLQALISPLLQQEQLLMGKTNDALQALTSLTQIIVPSPIVYHYLKKFIRQSTLLLTPKLSPHLRLLYDQAQADGFTLLAYHYSV